MYFRQIKEFERSLKTANVYGNPALCRFLLVDIENGDSKETLNVDGLTVEHIMPQTLGVEWNYISPEKHDEYVHVLGNLSVSGYNSELSNKSFAEKKKIIKENSKAVILNSDVWDRDTWNIADIASRGQRLADIILKRYEVKRISDDDIEFEYVTTLTLNNLHDVTGKKLVNFKFDGETYRQNKYALMLLDKNTEKGYACFEDDENVFEISKSDLQFDVKAFYQAFYSDDKDYEDIEVENCIPDDKDARRVYQCIVQLISKIKEKLLEMPDDVDETMEDESKED